MSCDLCKYCGDYAYFKDGNGEYVCSKRLETGQCSPSDKNIFSDGINHRSQILNSQKIKIGRNHLCICGSGKKYKYCCLKQLKS